MNDIEIKDFFIIKNLEVVENNVNFDLDILDKGHQLIEDETKKDPTWTIEKYFTDIMTKAIKSYTKENAATKQESN